MTTLAQLHDTLRQRKRPEDVAQMILEIHGDRLRPDERALLQTAAKGSLKQQVFGITSMLEAFREPVGLQKQVAKAQELFTFAYPLAPENCSDMEKVESFLRHVGPEIQKAFGDNDFKTNRLNHEARTRLGLDISRRRYNKLFRHLTRMEAKLHTLVRETKKFEFTLVGKSALAHLLPYDEFAKSVDSACFIAYLTARSNLRSEFTISPQQRAFDEIAAILFNRCGRGRAVNWWAIAHVFPREDVLSHLTDTQKGMLLGQWHTILHDVAALLKEVWANSDIALDTMIVRRGNDSTTWNNTASAWNKARDNWIALLYALGMIEVLDVICPGKVLRLMAADVVMWHSLSGGKLDPNTAVWRELPRPWEVLAGNASCTRSQVEAVCKKHGLDPEKSAWTAPRPRTDVAAFRPTPELVHGVTVANPYLARLLRQAGYFSGKPLSSGPNS